MTIPKYVAEILERAEYSFCKEAIPGYTIKISKWNHYEYADTFRKEIERLIAWANREYKKASKTDEQIAFIIDVPKETKHKYMQYATVTIYDPIMRHIEKYIAK